MSYYSSDGGEVRQAAAGMGATLRAPQCPPGSRPALSTRGVRCERIPGAGYPYRPPGIRGLGLMTSFGPGQQYQSWEQAAGTRFPHLMGTLPECLGGRDFRDVRLCATAPGAAGCPGERRLGRLLEIPECEGREMTPLPARVPQGAAAETPVPVYSGEGGSEYDCMVRYYQAKGGMAPEYAGMSEGERDEAGFQEYLACREAAFSFQPPSVAAGQRVPYGKAMRPYRDGVFSQGPTMEEYGTATRPFRDGVLGRLRGMGQYQEAVFQEGANKLPGGYVYTPGGTTLDLKDPAVLREVKMLTAAQDFDVPYWTDTTQAAFNEYASVVEKMEPGMSAWMAAPAVDSKGVPHMVPTAVGVRVLLEITAEAQGISDISDPKVAAAYPNVVAWAKENATDDFNFTGLVNPPAFSESELPKKKVATMLYVGIGVAAVAVGYLIFGKKRS